MIPASLSKSSIFIFSLVVGVSISTNAETVRVMDKASKDGAFAIAQTNGVDRRQDRRGDRQDCLNKEGLSAPTSATANRKAARPGVVKSTCWQPPAVAYGFSSTQASRNAVAERA